MGSYELLIKASAAKELKSLPRRERTRIVKRLQALASEPRPKGVERLSIRDLLRVRQGEYRVLYEVSDPRRTVTIIKIGHRREVYR